MTWKLLTILVLLALFHQSVQQDNCKYTMYSPDQTHTGCLPPNTSCTILNQGVNQAEQDTILRVLNQLRSRVAEGQQPGASGNLPTAKNMRQLNWNPELADLAQKHTNQCTLDYDCFNCRKVEDYATGEILYFSTDNGNFQRSDWQAALTFLTAQGSKTLTSVMANQYKISSFTQMIWGITKDVGCGFTRFKSSNSPVRFSGMYCCLFGPSGNYVEQNIYETGDVCSDCTYRNVCCDSTCSKVDYNGLCKLQN